MASRQTLRPPSTPVRNASIFSKALPLTLVSELASLRAMAVMTASSRSPAESYSVSSRVSGIGGTMYATHAPVRQSLNSARGSPVF